MAFNKIQNYNVIYRPIKYPRIEFKTGNLTLILPYGYKPENLVEKHQKWIKEKREFIEKILREARNRRLVKRSEKKFRNLIFQIVTEFSDELGVKVNRIFFRKMKTKWASYSSNKNLTINTLVKYLPAHLIKYLAYHEIAHGLQKRHNQQFWDVIVKKYPNYQNHEKELLAYWFVLQTTNSMEKSVNSYNLDSPIYMRLKSF